MSKEILLYSVSKKLVHPWDGNKLGLLQQTTSNAAFLPTDEVYTASMVVIQ
jgi:hypothetical protein